MSFETIWVKVRADMADFDRKMQGMKGSLNRVGNSMKSVGSSMTAGLTVPIALFGVATLKAVGDFESGMNKVQAMSNATGNEFESLRNQAKDLGRTTQFSASQSADAMGFLAMAGLEANKILSAMPDTLNLAASANLDFASTADIITNVLTGMKVPMNELPKAVDVLSKAFTSSNTDLLQLGEAMAKVGPVSANFGISLEETTAALGLLGNAGMQAGIAGTGFRRILTKLITEQDQLGIKTTDATGKLRPFADIIQDLEKRAFSGADAMEVFGDRGGPAMINLMAAGSKSIRDFTTTLKDSGGTAERIAKVQMKGLNGAIKSVKSAFEAFQISLGESGLLKWVTDFAKGIAEFFRELSVANPALMRMGIAIAAVVAVIGPMALIMGSLITATGALLGPITLVVTALAALAAVGASVALEGSTLSKSIMKEKDDLNSLVGAITSVHTTQESRLLLIEKMQKKYPDFLKNIDAEKISNEQLKTALENVNKEYDKKILYALKEEETDKLRTKRIQLQLRELDLIEQITTAEREGTNVSKTNATTGATGIETQVNAYDKLLGSLELNRSKQENVTDAIQKTIDKYDTLLGKQGVVVLDIDNGGVSATGESPLPPVGSPVADNTGILLLEEEIQQRILVLNANKILLAGQFQEQLDIEAQKYRISNGLIEEQIKLAQKAADEDPSDENLAKLVNLQTKKLQAEQDYFAEVRTLTDEHNASEEVKNEERLQAHFARLERKIAKDKENIALELEDIQTAEDKKKAIWMASAQVATSILGLVASMNANALNAELKAAGDNEAAKTAIRKKHAREAQKVAIAQSIMNTAVAVTSLIGNVPAMIAAGAAGLIQTGIIASQSFAKGGVVYGPTLAMVGDNPNSRRDPEIISPLSKLKGMIAGSGGSGQVEVFGVISGEDIYLSSKEYERKLGNSN